MQQPGTNCSALAVKRFESNKLQSADLSSPVAKMLDGLAVHRFGIGPPIFLVPNPQGMVLGPPASSTLAQSLERLPRTVTTFDPPGSFASTRFGRLGIDEMLDCIDQVLTTVAQPVDLVAHSQATLVALAYAADPQRRCTVRSMTLIGPVDGGVRTTRRARGMPWCWTPADPRFWRFCWRGIKAVTGNLADVKRLQQAFTIESYVDRSLAPIVPIDPQDGHRPRPARTRWQASVRQIDLAPRLPSIQVPTLVCVGRYDLQTPASDATRIAKALPRSRLVIFERSGHYPFVEEPDRFLEETRGFLASTPEPNASHAFNSRTSAEGIPFVHQWS